MRAIIPSLFEPELPWLAFVLVLQNFAMVIRKTMGCEWLSVTWSLAVEVHFYFLASLASMLLKINRQIFVSLLVALVVLAMVLRHFFPGGYVLMPWHGDALYGGFLLSVLWRKTVFRKRLVALNPQVWGLCLGVNLMLILIVANAGRGMGDWLLQSLMALVSLLLLLSLLANSGSIWCWLFGSLSPLGKNSYGIYLLHMPVGGMIFGVVSGNGPKAIDTLSVILCITSGLITWLLASLSFKHLETPAINYARTIPYD